MTKLTDAEPEPTTVTLSDDLSDRIDERIEHTRFDSREAYVLAALDALLTAAGDQDDTSGGERAPDSQQSDAVEDRLESLGYL